MMVPTEDPSLPEISWLATLVATLLAFALGALWYGPLFGKAWMAEQGFVEEDLMRDFNPAKTYGTTALLTAETSPLAPFVESAALRCSPHRQREMSSWESEPVVSTTRAGSSRRSMSGRRVHSPGTF